MRERERERERELVMSSSNPNFFPKSPFPNTITLRIRASTDEVFEDTNIIMSSY
jgi:hypothetical protein